MGSVKSQAAFDAAFDKGKKAFDAKNYPVAILSLKQALDLRPTHPQARQLYDLANTAQSAAQKTAAGDAAYLQALRTGKEHMATKNYPAAIQAGQEALKHRPGDQAATQLVQQATSLQQQAATADAAYTQSLKTGQQHMATKNYPAAIQAAQEALKHRPGDQAATQLVQQATSLQQSAAKDAAFTQALGAAQKAFAAKNYAAAIQGAQEALRDRPNDPQATALLQQASSAQNAASAAVVAEQKKKASFSEAVQKGQLLIGQKKFAEALQSLQSANGLYPNDPTVAQLMAQATSGDCGRRLPCRCRLRCRRPRPPCRRWIPRRRPRRRRRRRKPTIERRCRSIWRTVRTR